ncbi:hypothetical protein [Deinococcus cellulosilyticus]|uniref:Uncharacterized protein n=1 Tax=Deinococcus cellulosilyticus (strain DSM 18568 / NBRC 106333 / KACC 11606 / 5516J-15) TaxID=1223518 RepID=A0A511MXI7_DEIC1|nr:hypothetical protein [Deinococcus cellulosilyticus]GEM45305.1 hypothetical protein DC3_09400 [Deinococcus cellulosilyticus NBRC 106333 = KACC 11606]
MKQSAPELIRVGIYSAIGALIVGSVVYGVLYVIQAPIAPKSQPLSLKPTCPCKEKDQK